MLPILPRPSLRRFSAGGLLAAAVGLGGIAAVAAPNPVDVTFPAGQAVLWLGHTQVLPLLATKASADADTPLTATVADPRLAEVIREPVFLSGEKTAYIRVRALQPGKTRLEVAGGPGLDIEVKPDPAETAYAGVSAEPERPRIVSPMPDATVWGDFGVSVVVFERPDPTSSSSSEPMSKPSEKKPPERMAASVAAGGAEVGAAAAASNGLPAALAAAAAKPATTPTPAAAPAEPPPSLKVQLRLPDGRLLDATASTAPAFGPQRQFQFHVPAANLPAGTLELVAIATRQASAGGKMPPALPMESAPVQVAMIKPPAETLQAGECESPDISGPTRLLFAPARPARYGTTAPGVVPDKNASGGKAVKNPVPGWCLPFMVKEAGDYRMMILARAEFGGGAYPTAALYLNDSLDPVGLVRLPGPNYDRVPVGGVMHLAAGPQMLAIQYKNGFNSGKENRAFYLDRYELVRIGDTAAAVPADANKPGQAVAAAAIPAPVGLHSPAPLTLSPATAGLTPAPLPQLNIVYPAVRAEVYGADAVVVKARGISGSGGSGGARVDSIDILLDGQPQRVALRNPSLAEPMVFPLILRGQDPGEHQLTVRATAAGGKTVESTPIPILVAAQAPATRGAYERAVWLLDRLAFGPEPAELAAILTQGENKWLWARMRQPLSDPSELSALTQACKNYGLVDSGNHVPLRTLDQWMNSGNPVRARFTAWAENHFSTWVNKAKPGPKWHEHLAFATLGIAPLGDLLEVSAHSTAMLAYLDQEKSVAGKLNENYAREIMELHTLGVHGGYVQNDVTELAEVLNGWSTAVEADLHVSDTALHLVSDERGNEAGLTREFRFIPALNDGKARRVLGLQFAPADPTSRYDRVQLALEMLTAHPSTAQHVCRKLAEHYVGVPAPDSLVDALAASYLQTGGDMRAVLAAMVAHPAFWDAPPKVATPFDFGMRIARLCRAAGQQANVPADQSMRPEALESFMKHSGMGIFDRSTPDGYPENSDAYADSNALLQRWRFMQAQLGPIARLVPFYWRNPAPPANLDEFNRSASTEVDAGQRFIDLAAVRLTGRLLTPDSNKAALDVLGQDRPEDLQQALIFVSLLPENSLR